MKKSISMLLATALTGTMLAGCGGAASSSQASSAANNSTPPPAM